MSDQKDWETAECCGERMSVCGYFGEQYICHKCGKLINRVAILELMVLEAQAARAELGAGPGASEEVRGGH